MCKKKSCEGGARREEEEAEEFEYLNEKGAMQVNRPGVGAASLGPRG
jgi:hypothetical protein